MENIFKSHNREFHVTRQNNQGRIQFFKGGGVLSFCPPPLYELEGCPYLVVRLVGVGQNHSTPPLNSPKLRVIV